MNIQTISEKFQLNTDEQKILIYMNQHRNEIKNINIRELAKRTFTSPSFIVKTCKKMKLSGYSELVFLIADAPNFPNNTEIIDIEKIIEQIKGNLPNQGVILND